VTKTVQTTSVADLKSLIFSGRYEEALQQPNLSTRWKVLSLLGLSRLDEAEEVIEMARDQGENDAVAYLAAIHRLRGDDRAWLLESRVPVTNHFEYCVLLRETAAYHLESGKPHLAEEHLDRALYLTSCDEDTKQLLPSIAHWYSNVARHLGHDAAAVPILRDGLNIAIAGRRRPLLVELAYTYTLLGDISSLQLTLEEIKVNPPAPETIEGFIVTYCEARLLHLQGDVQAAHRAFEGLHDDASHWEVHMSFYAAVWCALTQLEPTFKHKKGEKIDPYEWLALMRDHGSYVPKRLAQAWMTCIEAIIEHNPQTATRAAEQFKEAFAKREECFARALPAVFETNKAKNQTPLEHVVRESMTEALEIAQEISNYAPIKQAMRFSKEASALTKYWPTTEAGFEIMPLVIRDGKAFRDGSEQRLTRHAKAVQILEYFQKALDGVVLDDMLRAVFAESELENSRKYWTSMRPILERETQARFERRKVKNKHLWFMLTDEKAVAVPQKVA
jgi:hypothetical protein